MVETSARTLGASRPAIAAVAGVIAALFIVAAALWLHYGTAVFYEVIAAGIAMCL